VKKFVEIRVELKGEGVSVRGAAMTIARLFRDRCVGVFHDHPTYLEFVKPETITASVILKEDSEG
jgi:hypothetical protein